MIWFRIDDDWFDLSSLFIDILSAPKWEVLWAQPQISGILAPSDLTFANVAPTLERLSFNPYLGLDKLFRPSLISSSI